MDEFVEIAKLLACNDSSVPSVSASVSRLEHLTSDQPRLQFSKHTQKTFSSYKVQQIIGNLLKAFKTQQFSRNLNVPFLKS